MANRSCHEQVLFLDTLLAFCQEQDAASQQVYLYTKVANGQAQVSVESNMHTEASLSLKNLN